MTLDIKRILVPLDFSATSQLALDYAHAMARRLSSTLHLVHVCEVPAVTAGTRDSYALAYHDWSERLGEEAQLELTRIQGDITDVPVSAEVLFGSPAHTIVAAAHGTRADLIVMGTHGHGVVMHMVMGNVAERVVRTAPCPVLTVRPHCDAKRAKPVDAKVAKPLARLSAACGFAVQARPAQ